MPTDECLACAGEITRTGHLPPREPGGEPVPAGFCNQCKNVQALRNGVWLPVGPPS